MGKKLAEKSRVARAVSSPHGTAIHRFSSSFPPSPEKTPRGGHRSLIPDDRLLPQHFRKDEEGYGAVRAIDPKTGDTKWEFKMADVTDAGILTTASDLRTKTDPKTVQALLRHSDVKTTLQLYAHSVSEDRMAAQEKCSRPFCSRAAKQ